VGQKKQYQVKQLQKVKRKKRRDKIAKAGGNPNDYYVAGLCIGTPSK
jgi:hypothetical protein